MKLFRYRAPSWRTLLGLTRLKKEVKKELGINEVMKPFRWYGNEKRKLKREMGYESEEGKLLRDGIPTPLGMHEGHRHRRGMTGISFCTFVLMEIVQVLMFDHHHDHRKQHNK